MHKIQQKLLLLCLYFNLFKEENHRTAIDLERSVELEVTKILNVKIENQNFQLGHHLEPFSLNINGPGSELLSQNAVDDCMSQMSYLWLR